MKIALSFPGCHRRGGVERVVFECARYLAQHENDVTVFANEWDKDEEAPIRYEYVPIRKQPSFLRPLSYFQNATRLIDPGKFDVLNTHGCVCPTGGVHLVHSLHRAWLERSREMRGPLSAARWKQKLNPIHPVLLRLEALHFAERRYRKLIALTPQVKSDLHRLYDVPLEDVIVNPNGFSPTEFSPERRAARRNEMREHLGLKPDQTVLLFVANELERKGYPALIEAMRLLNDPSVRLLVVGRSDSASARRQAQEKGVSDQVIICGPTQDVSGFHAAADLFVLPTQYEAFCLAILEALGSGLPVVTTRVPGAQDAIQPGINGALVDDPKSGPMLAAALGPLLDKTARDALSDAAPASVLAYQWPTVFANYANILQQYSH
ncbi:MAG: glycosyltransferase family 4 protein [Janthinobacterium lividum]